MKTDMLHDALLQSVKERLPRGESMASLLMDTLCIGKEAVYRRLRGEVPFSLKEAAAISYTLGVSLDTIIGATTEKSRPFMMKILDYSNPTEIDYAMLQNYVDILRTGRDDPYSELTASANVFPHQLYIKYDYLTRFYLFKWTYHHEKGAIKTFEDVIVPAKLREIQEDSYIEHMHVKTTCFIFDNMICQYLVNDIKYFAGIRLISEENVQNLKEDLHRFMNDLEKLAMTARFETGNHVYFYVSNINFESSYSYLQVDNYNISIIEAFVLNAAASVDINNYERLKLWVLSLRRLSTLISQSGELQRIQFFKNQREIINTL